MLRKTKRFDFRILFKILGILMLFICLLITIPPYFVSLPQYDDNKSPKHFDNSDYLYVDDIKLHYQKWDVNTQNPVGKILLVHGFYGSTFTWRKNANALVEKGFYVVAVDLPGFGYSTKKPGINHSIESRASLLWDFIANIDSNYKEGKHLKWILIGHSLGCAVVTKMAEQRQEQIDKLILVTPAINISKNKFLFLLGNSLLKKWISIFAEYFLFSKISIKVILGSAYGREPTHEEIEGYLNPIKQLGTSIAAADIVNAIQGKVDLSKIKIPTKIIKGEKDSWISSSDVDKVRNGLEFSSIYEIKGAGHIPQETHYEEFNDVIISFLNV